MTASTRGLAILTAIALALGLVLALEAPRRGLAVEHRLVPELAVDRVDRLTLGEVALVRDGGGWRVDAPTPGPADPAAVADVLAALAGARWEREVTDAPVARTGLDRARVVAIGTGGATVRLAIGARVDGADQVWVAVDGGPPRLAPAWLASATARGVAELRAHELVRVAAADITGVELHGAVAGTRVDLVASGAPLVGRYDGGGGRLAPAVARALTEALAAARAVDFPPPGPEPDGGLTIRVLGGPAVDELVIAGPCPGASGRLVTGTVGRVCVDDGVAARITDAARVAADPLTAIDPAPLAPGWASVTWPSGVALKIDGGGFALIVPSAVAPPPGGHDAPVDRVPPPGDPAATAGPPTAAVPVPADDAAARALAVALTAPGQVVRVPDGAVFAPALVARYPDGREDRLERAGDLVRRAGEVVAIRVDAAARAALAATARDLRDRGLIAEDATALTALVATARGQVRRADRGDVIGEWRGGLDGARVNAAAEALAGLRATAFVDALAFAPVLRLEATFAPPPVAGAQPTVHVVELDAACVARVDGTLARIDAERCRALRGVAP